MTWTAVLRLLKAVPWWAYVMAALVAAIGAQELRVRSLQAEAMDLSLHVDSLEVAADSTRELTRLADGLASNLRIFQRRALQSELRADELDERLQEESRARLAAELQIDSLRARAEAPVVVDTVTDTRSASFDVRQEPFTVAAQVRLPPPPAPGEMDVSVDVDPIGLGVRLTCGETDGRVRPASVLLTTPEWLTARVDSVRQDPEVCNPGILDGPDDGRWVPSWLVAPAAGALGGYVVDQDPVDAGIGAGIGLTLDRVLRWVF